MNTTHEYGAMQLRLLLRRLRNSVAVLLMIVVFAQVFGVPRVRLESGRASIRITRLEKPVWNHVEDAAAYVWSRLLAETRP